MRDNTDSPLRPQTDSDFFAAAETMRAIGGGFASRLAGAYIYADQHNRARLHAAFPDLFTQYYNLNTRLSRQGQ